LKTINEFVLGFGSYLKAFDLLIRFRLYKYFLLLLLLIALFSFPVVLFDFITSFITGLIPFAKAQEFALTGVSLTATISGFFLLLILSPLLSIVSEEVGVKLRGKSYRFSLTQLVKDIVRGIKITLRNLFYQYILIAIISILMYVLPASKIISLFGSAAIFLVTAYFYGFSILDYAMENYRMNYQTSVNFVRQHAGLALGLGAVYYVIISINNLDFMAQKLGHFTVYWSAFAEAFVAFIGVIAASYLLYQYKKSDL